MPCVGLIDRWTDRHRQETPLMYNLCQNSNKVYWLCGQLKCNRSRDRVNESRCFVSWFTIWQTVRTTELLRHPLVIKEFEKKYNINVISVFNTGFENDSTEFCLLEWRPVSLFVPPVTGGTNRTQRWGELLRHFGCLLLLILISLYSSLVLLSSTGLPWEEILTSVETWCKRDWLCLPLTLLVWDVTIVCEMTYYDRLSVWGRVYFLVSSLICKCLLLIDMVFLWTLNSLLTVHSIRAFCLSVCRYLSIRCHNYKLISVLLFITMKKSMCCL